MIKKLAASIRQYKKQAIATPLFMVGEVAMETVIPLVMSSLIERAAVDSVSSALPKALLKSKSG